MKLIRGTQHVDKQLISAVSMIQKMTKLLSQCHEYMTPDGKALIAKMKRRNHLAKKALLLDGVYSLGSSNRRSITTKEREAIQPLLRTTLDSHFEVMYIKRIVLGNLVLYEKNYSIVCKRSNSFVKYGLVNFGEVQYFLSFSIANVPYVIAICSIIQIEHQPKTKYPLNVHVVSERTNMVVPVDIRSILKKCILV